VPTGAWAKGMPRKRATDPLAVPTTGPAGLSILAGVVT
jgi:hypothetical protein